MGNQAKSETTNGTQPTADAPSEIEQSLRRMYELGREHGYKDAMIDMELDRLIGLSQQDTPQPKAKSRVGKNATLAPEKE